MIVFYTAFILSVLNILAGIVGLPHAINWLLGTELPWYFIIPFAALIWISLVVSWINSLMGNVAGKLIYGANALAAPFGYEMLGVPYVAGLGIALLPLPIYFWIPSLMQLIDAKRHR